MILVIRTVIGVLCGALCGAIVLGLVFYLEARGDAGGGFLSMREVSGQWALVGMLWGAGPGGIIGLIIGAANLSARWGGVVGAITGAGIIVWLDPKGIFDFDFPWLASRYTLMGLMIGLATAFLLRLLWKP